MLKLLVILGTRPEAIKLCPLVLHLRSQAEFDVKVCATAQHRTMLDQVLSVFGVVPDDDLDLMRPAQTLAETTARMLVALGPVLQSRRPDMVIVQGDTTTTLAGAMAAFYQRIPIGHVEAGLRTGDMSQPFPEEMNRVLASRLSALHFAPTEGAAANLLAEGVDSRRIHVTGNTGIDAVLYVRDALENGSLHGNEWRECDASKRMVLVTAHRRENFGDGFERICRALLRLSARPDVQIVYPVHRNPNVLDPVNRLLHGRKNILLLEPLEYVPFVDLMRRAHLIITDSGGVQEEGPSLGKPILVMRDKTERPEAVDAGTVKLVGTDENRIVREADTLLDDAASYHRMCRVHNPYGDGHASSRIERAIRAFFDQ
ncbi:MAG TPA: UDP-N-acetylglucosamine 2-epimerase (non-hydrolyzing) [Bryobacteraceae bacterium]|nr:UDP-N-acetylglucosamine 2-epimerase (non-hydrolyzing) [Bryobacteraceae bacterium]